MASWPEFRPTRLLERLVAARVDFVVIGGFAGIAHGSARLTNDLDVSFATDPANLEALGKALVDLRGTLRGVSDDVPFVPDAATLRRAPLLTLDTEEGPLDLLADPPGSPGYPAVRRHAERLELAGLEVLIASIDDLMAMKRAAARPQDLIDLEELEAISRLRHTSPSREARARPEESASP